MQPTVTSRGSSIRARLASLAVAVATASASLAVASLVAVAPVAAAGNTITVTAASDTDVADGFCTLREALIAAETDAGYHGCAAGSSTGTDTIATWATGQNFGVATAFTPLTHSVVVDGRGGTITLAPTVANIFVVNGGTTTLRNLTLSGAKDTAIQVNAGGTFAITGVGISGNSPGDALIINSGGTVRVTTSSISSNTTGTSIIYSSGGSVVLASSTFVSTTSAQGVVYGFNGAAVTVTDSTFSGNHASSIGGSIYMGGGTLSVTGSSFDQGSAPVGGAIYAIGTTTTISKSTFTNSTASSTGGAVQTSGGSATISDSHFDGNTSLTGGSIYTFGPMTIRRTLIENSQATGTGGGGLYGDATVTASTFMGNIATYGGGIYVNGTTGSVSNSTFSDNIATQQGGALFVTDPIVISNSTLSRNASSTADGGAAIYANVGDVTVANSIVAGNLSNNVESDIDGSPVTTTVGNVIGPVANLDTYLDNSGAQANGGPTPTVRILRVSGSPFINKGSSAVCAASPVSGKDQRGVTRPTACDIGAMELESTAPVISSSPVLKLRSGFDAALSGAKGDANAAWAGKDTGGSGVKRYVLDRSVNGGSWTRLSSNVPAARYPQYVTPGASYRYRVRAVDWDGNASGWMYGPTMTGRLVQQTSGAISYGKTWTTSSGTTYSGGSVKYAKAAGASATFTFTGRSVAWVTTLGRTRGAAKIYVNGSYVTTVDLFADATAYRQQAWSKSWSSVGTRTVKIVVVGTSGRPRVDVDAFSVVR